MAELALAIVGLLPLLATSVKGLMLLHDALKTARKCMKHLEDIELDLDLQQTRFLNECLLLLRHTGESEASLNAMLSDPDHDGWRDDDIMEENLRLFLGASYRICEKVVSRINKILEDARTHLTCFDIVRQHKKPDESWKVAFRRLCQPVRFTFDKSGLEKKIKALRRRVEGLEAVRRQLDDFRRRDKQPAKDMMTLDTPDFVKVRQVSKEAYCALIASFKCTNKLHHEHSMSLSLDVEFIQGICLKMAITFKSGDLKSMEPPRYFFLRSATLKTTGMRKRSGSPDMLHSCASTVSKLKPWNEPSTQGNKRQKLNFPNSVTGAPAANMAASCAAPIRHDSPQIQAAKVVDNLNSMVRGVRSVDATPISTKLSPCIASLQLVDLSQHKFDISACNDTSHDHSAAKSAQTISTLCEYLRTQAKMTISIVQQFKLALKMAYAVLQYQSTPWLQEEWTISQLRLMPPGADTSEDLPLYISSKLMDSRAANAVLDGASADVAMTDAQRAPLTDAERHGIHNIPLFCLGVALLEVGHWKPASELADQALDSNPVETVRRVASTSTKLGKTYDKIIERCLRCDFAEGSNLNQVELQSAVYSSVITPLEEVIAKLEGLGL